MNRWDAKGPLWFDPITLMINSDQSIEASRLEYIYFVLVTLVDVLC